ncbi:hypothetical protein MNEG_5776 [Monoraphidium neglectum]|uniref:Uncharacterized protein n=1 Tax=Monoraphidium neglectum TaxID=145388 RepID=A0A0D2N945_9CHLO|nr:hypothetical protein MNEG_5776 [Monoraphidium neglectum]KIZ02181.1 hypothetical protein MNEG_5776 [Monoraphidium neglectum]|eukprot:XP_013901200.1 hypothetical protein MNEG_5776 [Monoraphidium neglectum]
MADQAAPADAPPMAMAQDPMSQAAQLQAAEAIRLQRERRRAAAMSSCARASCR